MQLRAEEKVPLIPYAPEDSDRTVRALCDLDDGLADGLLQMVARILHSSGAIDHAELHKIEIIDVAEGAYKALLIPLDYNSPLPFGHTPGAQALGNTYDYVWNHGTDEASCSLILREELVRPTDAGQEGLHSVAFYCQATQGSFNRHTVANVIDKELRISKGTHGCHILGSFSSKKQHYKVSWGQVPEEQRICAQRGSVRTPDHWAFCSVHAHIRALAFPLPA